MLKNKKYLVLSFILVLFLLYFLYIFSFYKVKVINENNIEKYYDTPNNMKYFGIINIPNLGISNIIYEKNTEDNNVNKNVYLVENINHSFIVLAAHSGDSSIAYFKNLNRLDEQMNVELIIKNRKRTYRLFFKTEVFKTGEIKLSEYEYPVLVLITCSKTDKNMQEVYYTRLVKSSNI